MATNALERRYAEMEAAANAAEDAYFKARPLIDTDSNRKLFREAFRRGFEWNREGGAS